MSTGDPRDPRPDDELPFDPKERSASPDPDDELAEELRYEGPITIEEDDAEDEPANEGGSRTLVMAFVLVGIVVVIIAVGLFLQDDGDEAPLDASAYPEAPAPVGSPSFEEEVDTPESAAGDTTDLAEGGAADAQRADESTTAAAGDVPRRPLPSTEPAPTTAAANPQQRSQPTPARETLEEPASRPAPKPTTLREQAGTVGVAKAVAEGRLDDAASIGRDALRATNAAWSLQVLLACEPSTVEKAFSQVNDPELYVVPATYRSRSCYRLLHGAYASRDEAASRRYSVPAYFRAAGAPVPFSLERL